MPEVPEFEQGRALRRKGLHETNVAAVSEQVSGGDFIVDMIKTGNGKELSIDVMGGVNLITASARMILLHDWIGLVDIVIIPHDRIFVKSVSISRTQPLFLEMTRNSVFYFVQIYEFLFETVVLSSRVF